jgi:hypothetical protein
MKIIIQTYNGMNEYTHKHHFSKEKVYEIAEDDITRVNNNGMGYFTIWKRKGRPKNIWYFYPEKYWLEENGKLNEYFGSPNWKKGQTFFKIDSNEGIDELYEFASANKILTLEQEWY